MGHDRVVTREAIFAGGTARSSRRLINMEERSMCARADPLPSEGRESKNRPASKIIEHLHIPAYSLTGNCLISILTMPETEFPSKTGECEHEAAESKP
jgi:hypothetical protein